MEPLAYNVYWTLDYFVTGLELFGYEDLSQVFWFDESLSPHLFSSTHGQPMQPFTCFQVLGVLYHIDCLNQLWLYDAEDSTWYSALVYTNVADALSQSLELFWSLHPVDNEFTPILTLGDASNSILGSLWEESGPSTEQTMTNPSPVNQYTTPIQNPSNPPDITTLNQSFINKTNIPVNPSESDITMALESLPATPNQEEIDGWVLQYRKFRRASKTQGGLPTITCPLPTCGRALRRLHALK
ncbi:hypothetical protein FRC12_021329, partial [Ceratobasidium sp. 428]